MLNMEGEGKSAAAGFSMEKSRWVKYFYSFDKVRWQLKAVN